MSVTQQFKAARNAATHVAASWCSTIFHAYAETNFKLEKLIPVLVNSVEIYELGEFLKMNSEYIIKEIRTNEVKRVCKIDFKMLVSLR